jgi:FkbM family methyltransferase
VRSIIFLCFDKKMLRHLKKPQQSLPSLALAVQQYLKKSHNADPVLRLKRNMDATSSVYIDRYLERQRMSSWLFSADELKVWEVVHASAVPYMFAPGSAWFPDVFVFHNGLKFVPPEDRKTISEGYIIDGGAAAGDSAIMFASYKPKGIYAVEPVASQCDALRMTLQMNNLLDSVTPVQLGLTDRSQEFVSIKESKGCIHSIGTVTIDDLVMSNKVSVIKLDIEGMELAAIYGARRTIMRDKPILLISIYHTPEDFFEIKPLIESWNLGYYFMVRETEVCNTGAGVHVMLVGYVNSCQATD